MFRSSDLAQWFSPRQEVSKTEQVRACVRGNSHKRLGLIALKRGTGFDNCHAPLSGADRGSVVDTREWEEGRYGALSIAPYRLLCYFTVLSLRVICARVSQEASCALGA